MSELFPHQGSNYVSERGDVKGFSDMTAAQQHEVIRSLVELSRTTTMTTPDLVTLSRAAVEILLEKTREYAAELEAALSSPAPTYRARAIEEIMIGGNHLANVLIAREGGDFAERYPPDMPIESALRLLCATQSYDIWVCWSAIMRAREIIVATTQPSEEGWIKVDRKAGPYHLRTDDEILIRYERGFNELFGDVLRLFGVAYRRASGER